MSADARRILVQVDRPTGTFTMTDAVAMLDIDGFDLDPGYGPICVNRAAGRFVVRGQASPAAEAQLHRIDGVRVFADAPVKPTAEAAAGRKTTDR